MKNKKNQNNVTNKPDSRLAGIHPTSHSEEYVPIPLDSLPDIPTNATDKMYDFIPELKSNKYKNDNKRK